MKTILITGCSSGFGLQMVGDLLKEGNRVIATLRKADERMSLFSDLVDTFGDRLIIKTLDVTNSQQRLDLRTFISNELDGKLDILINNAGIGYFGALEDFSEKQIREQMEVNFFAPSFITREYLSILRNSKGAVINITSIMGQYSTPLGSIYSASKYALEGMSEGLSYELSEYDVSVTTVAPGGHRTSFLESVVWGESSHNSDSTYFPLTKAFISFMKKLSSRPHAPRSNAVSLAIVKLVNKQGLGVKLPREVIIGKDAWFVALLRKMIPHCLYQRLMNKSYQLMLKRSVC